MTATIGIRELRQHASKYIALVKEGARIEITDRGRPVAMLTPLPGERETGLERLFRLGRLIPPETAGGVAGLRPLPMRPGQRPPSELLQEMRDDERS
ncbi:MAG: type II toxin-antitoxin system Phd/YefM family antitoxin [Dehalococcoidia bacterium]